MGPFGANGTINSAILSQMALFDFLAAHPQDFLVVNKTLVAYPSLEAWHRTYLAGNVNGTDSTGTSVTLGSRLIPASVCTDAAARAVAAAALSQVVMTGGSLTALVVAGGAVATADHASLSTSVTPAWRNALLHVVGGGGWANNATIAEQQATYTQVTDLANLLRTAIPQSGAYWSESDFLEPGA